MKPVEPSDADYQSFLVRIWREDKAKVSADDDGWSRVAKDSWLFQLEDIASGETRYFHDSGELADYMDNKLGADTKPFRTGGK